MMYISDSASVDLAGLPTDVCDSGVPPPARSGLLHAAHAGRRLHLPRQAGLQLHLRVQCRPHHQVLMLIQWTVPQLSIMIIYNCTWSILIK